MQLCKLFSKYVKEKKIKWTTAHISLTTLALLTPATFKKRFYFDFLSPWFKFLVISYLFLCTGQLELEVG